ncbi:MAG TPA: ASCH domain-containing protein [Pseudonocardiaceae bacterium]|nr:ASCH domain-containing protein [Pseudonocardiaceae bacterium]
MLGFVGTMLDWGHAHKSPVADELVAAIGRLLRRGLPVWLVSALLTDPKHFFRSFTVKELGRLMTAHPAEAVVRAHEMGIYKRYFDLIATGRKTTEIRVDDSSRRKIKEGSLIRFRCQGDQVLTRVTRVARYASFDEMFDHESVASVNPLATRAEQLANIRQIYPPEREALGVVALGIELLDPSWRARTL